MTTIILGTFFGTRLNLDGDQGNYLALRKFLNAAGFDVEIRSVNSTESAQNCHFLLLGHGSDAAMQSIDAQLGAVDFAALQEQVPGLAVGSGYEWLASHGFTKSTPNHGDRVSDFKVAKLGKLEALGYVNSDTGLPELELNGGFICTLLHGPVLAKNPKLLANAARAAVSKAGLDWPEEPSQELAEWVTTLNRISSKLWLQEAEQDLDPLSF